MATETRGRGRPPKNKSQNAEEIKTVDNKNSSEETITIKKSEFEQMMNFIKKMEELEKNKTTKTEEVISPNALASLDSQDSFDEENVDIPLHSFIKVMSLIPYTLNISTERGGKGRIFTFRGFGETKRIIYQEVNQLIETYRHFLEKGYFIILDKRVVRKHGLNDIYERILSKENIDFIFMGLQEGNVRKNDVLSMLKSAPKGQQEMIATMIIDKRINGEMVDLNLFDQMGRMLGIDLNQKYDDTLAFLESAKQ